MTSMSPARLLLGTAVPVLALCAASAQAVPARSPAQVAFTRFKSSVYPEIWTASGRGRRRLIRVRNAGADEPAWSPSGRSIAFTVDRNPPEGPRIAIYVARADGTGLHRVVGGRSQDYAPAWSPDGRWIAFAKASYGGFRSLGVFVVRADGRMAHRLTRDACDDTPAWAPAGRQLVVSRCGSLYVVGADGTHARRLTTPPPPDPSDGGEFTDVEPDWSPDGRWIAFTRSEQFDPGGGEIDYLYVIRPDGTGERQVTDGGFDRSPAWSPDGRRLAYASYTGISTVVVSTGQTRTMVPSRGADLSSPAWRP
jgi:Tol biopolymer transport system component